MKRRVLMSVGAVVLTALALIEIYNQSVMSPVFSGNAPMKLIICRMMAALCVSAFVMLNIWVDIRKLYDFIHKYRYVIGAAVLLLFVLGKFNFSSIGMFEYYIEEGEGTQFCQPVFGTPRSIRSDEWLVSTPLVMTGKYSDPVYSETNEIVMARETTNLSSAGFQVGLCMLASPQNWLYATGNVAYGLSFRWGFILILGILAGYDFFLIITGDKRLLSLMGMAMVIFSSIFMWWSYMTHIVYALASLVAFYYFIKYEKTWQRILLAVCLVISASSFIVVLYPAWQVPVGYFVLVMLVWMICINIEKIKQFRLKDIGIIIGGVILLAGVVVSFIHQNMQYITEVMQTVYPGKRESFGYYSLGELFYYPQTVLYPYFDVGNPSEFSVFYTFFPLPIILALWFFIKNKDKKQDLLTPMLLTLSVVLGGYCCFEYPHKLAKLLLLTYSTPERMADVFGLVQVVLFIYILGKYDSEERFHPAVALLIAMADVAPAAYFCMKEFRDYLEGGKLAVVCLTAVVTVFLIISRGGRHRLNEAGYIIISMVLIITGMSVHPLMRGADTLFSKPVEKKIASMAGKDEDGVWIGMDNLALPAVMIANGAPTLNCVNYVPNYELWEKLDPEKKYEEIWNRYAHVYVNFTEGDTEVVLNQPDVITVLLSYKDIPLTDLDYVVSMHPIENNNGISFKKKFHKDGYYIYKVSY